MVLFQICGLLTEFVIHCFLTIILKAFLLGMSLSKNKIQLQRQSTGNGKGEADAWVKQEINNSEFQSISSYTINENDLAFTSN